MKEEFRIVIEPNGPLEMRLTVGGTKEEVIMGKPNWINRTMWTGDNLDIMRGMNSESVDLIYLDPPFNSNRNYAAPIGSEAAGAAFKDTWTLDDVDLAWHGEIAEQHPALYAIIAAAREAHGASMQSYLIMMGVRLLEMRRLLKPTGSIYVHCDPTASHYLKLLMDAVFGRDNFRNELIWKRTSGKQTKRKFPSNHDVILFYVTSSATRINPVHVQHDPAYVAKFYRSKDRYGHFRISDLTAAEIRSGDSGMSWRGIEITEKGRHWAVPRTMPEHVVLPANWTDKTTQEKLDFLDNAGLIYWPSKGSMPGFKRYLSTSKGSPMTDVIFDIEPLSAQAKEKVGYPTQKPLLLLDRIIKASSNEGDMVLDPFCGCATACVAADRLNRQWVGIDLSPLAARLVKNRIQTEGPLLYDLIHRTDIPKRTDVGQVPHYRTQKHTLFGLQEGICNGCRIAFPFRNFTVDHIIPRSRGGTDHPENLQLLCAACNSLKGNRTQAELIAALRRGGIIDR